MSYAIENEILVADLDYPLYRFTNTDIVLNSLSGVFTVDAIGNELSIDTWSVTIRHDTTGAATLYAPIGADAYRTLGGPLYSLATQPGREYMTELPYGTPVFWICGGALLKKGYIKAIDRLSKYAWRITAISGIGLLDNSYHAGGVYDGESVEDVLTEIIGGTFPFTVTEAAATNAVYGWLPYDKRRANLHRLLFALGVSALPGGDADTDYVFGFLSEDDPGDIPDSRIALGGSVDYQLPATGAEVEEHTYAASAGDETVTLYSTAAPVVSQTVVFDRPCHDLNGGGLTVEESGVNYAVVSGVGTLTGQAYAHYTTIVAFGGGSNVKRVTGNGLITALNSVSVAQRVLAYYRDGRTVRAKLISNGETPGRAYNFVDPFSEAAFGFLSRMQLGVTTIKAATCDFVVGYSPTGQGNTYTHSLVLTGSGSWTVPADVTMIRIVVCSGGDGGTGGENGELGWGLYYQDPDAGHGGQGGRAGSGGRWLQLDLTVTPGESFAYASGVGGGSDQLGTDTTFGDYSSADGAATSNGFVDILTGIRYATPGVDGLRGADQGGDWIRGDDAYYGGEKAEDFDYSTVKVYGGSGGGAAYGANGSDGELGYVDVRSGVLYGIYGGNGGDGGTPTVNGEDAAQLGGGGSGGHGGGGGGDAGTVDPAYTGLTWDGISGGGGIGSLGGRGGDGFVLVYY